jgi:hypothetical protein
VPRLYVFFILERSVLRRRASSAASFKSHARKTVILGSADAAFGQTIQYVLDLLKDTSIGETQQRKVTPPRLATLADPPLAGEG